MEKDNRMEQLARYDTPSITNVVATYPGRENECLGLYNPWQTNWYTNDEVRCIYPELGARAGYVVTAVVGERDPNFTRLSDAELYRAIERSPKPVVLVVQQQMPDNIRKKNGMYGGLMTTAFKKLGCVGVVSNGPSRDVDEIRPMEFQYLLTGVTPGHGDFALYAVNVPVSVCGMDTAPGEVVHMDENGAVKFPAEHIDDVLRLSEKLLQRETETKRRIEQAKDIDELLASFKY